jgi:hypothetical protein
MNATLTPEISAFAAAVRRQLDDLPADDVDDLLEGLDADLADQVADSDGDFVFPDAAVYAAELRQAAGLPERAQGPAPRVPVRERMEELRADVARRIRNNAAGAWILDLLVALRPVWWLVRGVALYAILALALFPFFGYGLGLEVFIGWSNGSFTVTVLGWGALFAAVLLSVQWGRGRWLPGRSTRILRSIVNAVTAVAAAIMVISAPTVLPQVVYAAQPTTYVDNSQPGLMFDGARVRNVFPYDAEGNPLTGVQLFDDQGRALTTVGVAGVDEAWQWDQYFVGGGGPVTAPAAGTGTRPVWNVFPLLESTSADEWGEPTPGSAKPPVAPFPEVPATPFITQPTDRPTPVPTDAADSASGSPSTPTAPTPTPTPSP